MSTELDGGDWQLLNNLNFGEIVPKQFTTHRVVKLKQRGLIDQNTDGRIVITMHGQLSLYRHRYRDLPKSKYVIIGEAPHKNIWFKIRR